jgi:hypothetical protein
MFPDTRYRPGETYMDRSDGASGLSLAFAVICLLITASSCTSLNITNYYHKHRSALDSIEQTFQKAYYKKPFSIEFTDRAFDRVSLELMTDLRPVQITSILQINDYIDRQGHDDGIEEEGEDPMQQRHSPDLAGRDLYIGDLERHADHKSKIGEIQVIRP